MTLRKLWQGREARGRAAEERVCRLMDDVVASVPWLTSWRPATSVEDERGVDIVTESDVGPLYLQVKAGKRGASRPVYRERGIGVVVAHVAKNDWHVEADLRETLSGLRAQTIASATTFERMAALMDSER